MSFQDKIVQTLKAGPMIGMTGSQIRDALDPDDFGVPAGKVHAALMSLKYHGAINEHTVDRHGPLGMPMRKTYYRLIGPTGRVATSSQMQVSGKPETA